MSQLPRYESYKDSGVQWLGEIPSHWKVTRLKFMAKIQNGSDYKHVQAEDGYPVIGSGGQFTYATEYLYKGESVLLGRKGTIDRPLYVNCAFWTVDTMYYTEIFNITFPKFLYYCALTVDFWKYSTQTALPSMTQTALSNLMFATPEYAEQKVIADFLDKRLAQVDALIAKQETLLEKLAEQRVALISHAVTKGLNPDVEMRDSKIRWVKDIPIHWNVVPVRYLFEFKNNQRIPVSAEDRGKMSEKIYPYYGASGIIDFVEDYIFDEDLLLVAEDGANLLSRSTPLAFKASGKYWVNNHAHIIKPVDNNLTYWEYVLALYDFTPLISGSAQPKLTKDNLASIKLPNPPDKEKHEICNFLDKPLENLKEQKLKIEKILETLKEYRSTLITQVVTGKIDVRNLKVN